MKSQKLVDLVVSKSELNFDPQIWAVDRWQAILTALIFEGTESWRKLYELCVTIQFLFYPPLSVCKLPHKREIVNVQS